MAYPTILFALSLHELITGAGLSARGALVEAHRIHPLLTCAWDAAGQSPRTALRRTSCNSRGNAPHIEQRSQVSSWARKVDSAGERYQRKYEKDGQQTLLWSDNANAGIPKLRLLQIPYRCRMLCLSNKTIRSSILPYNAFSPTSSTQLERRRVGRPRRLLLSKTSALHPTVTHKLNRHGQSQV